MNIDAELEGLIRQGQEIAAIKKYRAVTGLGLKEAKEHIDRLMLKGQIQE